MECPAPARPCPPLPAPARPCPRPAVSPAERTADQPRRVFGVQRSYLLGARRARGARRAAREQLVLVVLKHVHPLPGVAVEAHVRAGARLPDLTVAAAAAAAAGERVRGGRAGGRVGERVDG
jgi:hypothetical protein